jgi:hypothetical protein
LLATVAPAPPQALRSMLVPPASMPIRTARRATDAGELSSSELCCIVLALLSNHRPWPELSGYVAPT